jgi:hypothetical protein
VAAPKKELIKKRESKIEVIDQWTNNLYCDQWILPPAGYKQPDEKYVLPTANHRQQNISKMDRSEPFIVDCVKNTHHHSSIFFKDPFESPVF